MLTQGWWCRTSMELFSKNFYLKFKEPALIQLDFFQSYCDFGTIRMVLFIFLIIILKFHALIPCRSEENIKNMTILLILVLTTINNYNHPLFELQRQFIFSPVIG